MRKSDINAFCVYHKAILYAQHEQLSKGKFLSFDEQKNNVLTQIKMIDLLHDLINQSEMNIGTITELQKCLSTVQTVENIIQSTLYKLTQSWK